MSSLPSVDSSGTEGNAPIHAPDFLNSFANTGFAGQDETLKVIAKESQSVADTKPRIMKRARVGVPSSSENSDESEPDEKRPAFRLQPPTLIHGQAKAVPKAAEGETDGSTKCKFLQPSKLSAPAISTSSAGMENSSAIRPSGMSSGSLISSSNPFLFMADKDSTENNEDVQSTSNTQPSFVFGTNLQQRVKVNGTDSNKDDSQPDSTSESENNCQEPVSGTTGNLFLQPSSSTSPSESIPEGFLFGKKMEDRVTVKVADSAVKHSEPDSGDNAHSITSTSFVFGENLADRAKVASSVTSSSSLFAARPSLEADSSTSANDNQADSEKNHPGGLEHSAAVHFAASQTRPIIPEVEVVTGEEDEKNVLQIQCKLYQFDATSQNWLERGVGILHLNDGKCSDDDLHFQSRLVMRTHGSLRLVLNTKIWAQMTVEKASKKSVRVSAQTGDGTIGVFLLTAAINDAEQVFRALEYRVRHQKQLEEKRKLFQKMEEETKPVNQPEASSSSEKDAASDLAPPANEVSTSEAQSTSAPDASHETEAAAAKLEAKSAPAVSSTSDDNDNKSAPGTQNQQDTPDTQQVVDSSAPLEP